MDPSGHTGLVPRYNVMLADTGVWRGFSGKWILIPKTIISTTPTGSGGSQTNITIETKRPITIDISIDDDFDFFVDLFSMSGDVVLTIVSLNDLLGPWFVLDDIIGKSYYDITQSVDTGQTVLSGGELLEGVFDLITETDFTNLTSASRGQAVDQIQNILSETGSKLFIDAGKLPPFIGAVFSYIDLQDNCEIEVERSN